MGNSYDAHFSDFIPCEAWNNRAELIKKWFSKGDLFAFDGSLKSSNYTDSTGAKRSSISVVVDQLHFVNGGNKGSKTQNNVDTSDTEAPPLTRFEDDDDISLPF